MVNKIKKAQMKIQQMSFMMIGVFIFFALVGMIVVTVMLSNIETSAKELDEQNANLMASRIASSPEFSCGEVYGGIKTDCIDLDKVMALKQNIAKYSNFWGISNIEIIRLYPPIIMNNKQVQIECNPTNYSKCNYIQLIDKTNTGFDRSNYVALCRKEKYKDEIVNKCEIGKIILRYSEETE